VTDWLKRGKEEQAAAKAQAARRHHAAYMANVKVKAPTWRVHDDQLTAKAQ